MRRNTPADFWARVEMQPHGCWPWTGYTHKSGYGELRYEGVHTKAHRVAYRLIFGDAGSAHVLHSCDNPACCRPSHLRAGTAADNSRDCVERGRLARGDRMPHAILNDACVLDARRRFAAGTRISELAAESGVAWNTMRLALVGRTWRHVLNPDEKAA